MPFVSAPFLPTVVSKLHFPSLYRSLSNRNLPYYQRTARKVFTMLLGLGLSLLLAGLPLHHSAAVPIASVPNPQTANGTWVSDTAEMLSPESEAELNWLITELEATTGTELAIVTVPDTQPSASPKAFATELFNTWGIGKEGIDNGVLFLISKGDRRNEVETGYGIEGILPDALVGQILSNQVTPEFKNGNFDAGVLAGTHAMVNILSGQAPASGLILPPSKSFTDKLPGLSFSWISNGLVAAIIGMATGAIALLKKLTKGHTEPIYIGATGRSKLDAPNNLFLGPLLTVALRSLLGKDMSQAKGLAGENAQPFRSNLSGNVFALLSTLANDRPANEHPTDSAHQPIKQESRLIAIRWSEDLIKSGWKLFGLFFIGSIIAAFVLQGKVLPLIACTWLWMNYETYLNRNWVAHTHSSASEQHLRQILRTTIAAALKISLTGGLMSLLLTITLGGLGLLIAPMFLAAFFGTCAGILRLVRGLPGDHAIHCQACDDPMQQLSPKQLHQHMRKAEQIEVELGNTLYEGWSCKTCAIGKSSEASGSQSLSIHLFAQVVNGRDYETCETCEALTVEVISTTLISASTTTAGSRLITKDCHCCEHHSEENVVIPKIVRSSSSSSSSYSSSYSSGSSYSSSSYSSDSGGSFGGGASGGGGAGDSW